MVFKRRPIKKLLKDKGKEKEKEQPQQDNHKKEDPPEDALSIELNQNIQYLQQAFGNSSDLSFSDFELDNKKAVLIYIDGLADKMIINHFFENISRSKSLIKHSEYLSKSPNVRASVGANTSADVRSYVICSFAFYFSKHNLSHRIHTCI
jgi:spore germination protein KA